MAKNNFDFKAVEKKWMDFWEKEKIYKFDVNTKKKIFSIDTPPPTVSGKMHIGSAGSYSQMDFIARFMRMRGFNLFYPFGTDDNGLATERLVEKSKNVRSRDMPRDKFIKLCLDYLKKENPGFVQGWKDIGISCDWDLYYSTINNHSRKISQWSFLDLYKKKRMERRDAPSMWCPECKTGVAQVEVEDKDISSTFVDVKLNVVTPKGVPSVKRDINTEGKDLIISTTRPELFPASVAVFYNPKDKRYKHLKGKTAKIPIFNIEVPIMEDKRAQMDKGTGIAYCATFGDQTDMEWQKAYNLEIKEAIDHDGKMTGLAGKYKGMKVKDARKEIIADLKKQGFLIKEEEITHPVNVHERCGTEIEFIKSKQWFLKYLDLKKEMLKWGAELNWYPKFMKTRYDNWVKGLQWDWLISNQRYFGIPFPVWYCEKCNEVILAEEKDLPVDPLQDNPPMKECPKCKGKEFIPEKDILNTWFTSSMSPQLAINLIDEKYRDKLLPMNLRPQAHDIISFWLFNTVVKSHLHFKKKPWSDVAISGFVTLKGEKMSKSKGNVVKPQEVTDKYGADALRFWAASSKLGKDFDYQEKDVVAGKKFVNKLLNASNFVFMNLEDWDGKKPKKLERVDELFLNKLNEVVKEATDSFEKYEYSKAKAVVENFFWKMFCDNYLEIVKKRIYNEKGNKKKSAQYTLYKSLLNLLKMMAPIIPFVTEEIYQEYFRKEKAHHGRTPKHFQKKCLQEAKSIHVCDWPEIDKSFKISIANNFDFFCDLLSKVRQEKTKAGKPMNSEIVLTIDKKNQKALESMEEDLKGVTNAREIKEGKFKVEF